ncbi:SDR family NAD(P)-dependent oxidoreductase [Methyloversatilis sp.]|uniref:SDR family NAD(P)-dependent oxidoreductase n=1 Tax=Methyloversatilis sp. TaxID=2569862 RepID=UPI003F72A27A
MNQQQKCVVITGGSRGLGLAIIHRLFEAGYAVATCSRHPTPELQALIEQHGSSSLLWVPAAIGDEGEEAAFFAAVIEWAGPRKVHALINNAAVAQDGILATLPNVDSTRIIEVNLLGSLRMSRLALRHMLGARCGGRIINISSIIGSRGYTGLAAYSASKAGLDGLTRALAREVGRRQITVNSVAPGYLETDMSAGLEQRQRAQIINRTPLGRLGTVHDVSPLVMFLLSEEAGFITGQTLTVDGGISC